MYQCCTTDISHISGITHVVCTQVCNIFFCFVRLLWWLLLFFSLSEGLQITCHQSFSSNNNENIETIFQIVSKMASSRVCLLFHKVYAMHIHERPASTDNFRMCAGMNMSHCLEERSVRCAAQFLTPHRQRRQAAFRHFSPLHIPSTAYYLHYNPFFIFEFRGGDGCCCFCFEFFFSLQRFFCSLSPWYFIFKRLNITYM